jgi:hypothetical protein
MKSVHLTLNDELVDAVDRAARRLGMTRSGFARKALRKALAELRRRDLEQRHRVGYERYPVKPEEFDVWELQQVWPEDKRAHKRKLREHKRQKAMKGYTKHDKDLFESLAGKSLKTR